MKKINEGFLRDFKIGDCVNDHLGAYLGRIQGIDPTQVKIRMFQLKYDTGAQVFQVFNRDQIFHAH